MKKFTRWMFLAVLVVLASLTGCASLFGEGWNPADASAQADGGGHDGSAVGETADAGDKTDTASVDAKVDGSDASDQDNGTDVAVLSCPSGKVETLLNGMEKSSCCSIVEVEAYELLSTHTAKPATNCPSFGDSDYCLADFEMLAATDPEGSCYRVKLWYPQNLKVKYTFSFDNCGTDKTCAHEKAGSEGGKIEVDLNIAKKLFSFHITSADGILDAKDYKLVPK